MRNGYFIISCPLQYSARYCSVGSGEVVLGTVRCGLVRKHHGGQVVNNFPFSNSGMVRYCKVSCGGVWSGVVR